VHIPDGYLGPATYATMFGAALPFWACSSWKLNRTLKSRQAPYLALGAAFSFVIMMFNIPVLGGTTGHAAGVPRLRAARALRLRLTGDDAAGRLAVRCPATAESAAYPGP